MAQSERFKGFVGQSYSLKNWNYDCQRLINRYIEYNETQLGKDGEPAQLVNTPGLTQLVSGLATGGSRNGYVTSSNDAYWVMGSTVYHIHGISGSSAGWSATNIGNINGYGMCQFADNGTTLFIVTSVGTVWGITLATDALTAMTGNGGNIINLGTLASGTLYTNGTYANVPMTGGSGTGATADIVVLNNSVFSATIVDGGVNYIGGDVISATAANIGGNSVSTGLLAGGSGYVNNVYPLVQLTGTGTGTGAIATLTVSNNVVTAVNFTTRGSGYTVGDVLTTANINLGGVGIGFSITVLTLGGYGFNIGVTIVGEGWQPATSCAYIDGYVVFTTMNSNQFYWTDLYSTSIVGFAAAETNADHVVGIIANNEDLWIFGENVVELWYDIGGGSTGNDIFQRRQLLVETGAASPHTIEKLGNTIIWLATDQRGGPIVYQANGYQPVRISTFAIEQMLSQCTSDQLANATADSYQMDGHFFYALNVPGLTSTLVFDQMGYVQSGIPQWHEKQSGFGQQATRSIAEGHCYFKGKHITGDYLTGKIYFFDKDNDTENGTLIARTRITPHISNGLVRMRYISLQIDYMAGTIVGQNQTVGGVVSAVDPQVQLSYSDDGGKTWSGDQIVSLGKTGQYTQRVIFYKLGVSRNRVFKIVDVNSCFSGISGAAIVYEPGNT